MLSHMLDTNICIYVMSRRSEKARLAFREHSGKMAISSVSLMELTCGAEKSRQVVENRQILDAFTSRLTILPFDAKAGTHAGQVKAQLEKNGTPIGGYDIMIAGHARAEGLVVVTNNLREFKRVEGLRVENWI